MKVILTVLRHKKMMIILIINGLRIETCTTPYLILNLNIQYINYIISQKQIICVTINFVIFSFSSMVNFHKCSNYWETPGATREISLQNFTCTPMSVC